jgi:hypothetical protein
LTSKQKSLAVAIYKIAVGAVVRSGWLSQGQADTLAGLADAL